MLRIHLAALVWLAAVPAILVAQPSTESGPDIETLRRLAQQLGTGSQPTPKISPEMLELAKKYLQNNPDLLKDPKFQEQMRKTQQQMAMNPKAYDEQLQKSGVTPEQLKKFRDEFPNLGDRPQPTPGSNPRPQPNFPPSTGSPQPSRPTSPFPEPAPRPEIPRPTQWQPGQPIPQPQPGQPQFPQPQPGQPFNPTTQQPRTGGPATPQAKERIAQNQEGYRTLSGLWEKNVGPLDKTPEMKQSLIDMFSGSGADGQNGFGGGRTSDWFKSMQSGNGSGNKPNMDGWFKNQNWNLTGGTGGPSWLKGWNFNLPQGSGASNWGGSGWSGGGGWGGGGLAFGSVGAIGIVFISVLVVAVVAFLLLKFWPQLKELALRGKPKALPGAGPWPIDPRDVHDRPTLVLAFEYLSVFICGEQACTWNHATIAEAFRDQVPGAAPFAEPLARLYAVARYTPKDEVLAEAAIDEARGYLCRIAGVAST